jgi:hypothetical protein
MTLTRTHAALAALAVVAFVAALAVGRSAFQAEPTPDDAAAAARTSFPDLEAASAEPQLPGLTALQPRPGEVLQAPGPFDDRFVLSDLHFDGGTLGGFKWSSQHLERGGARGQTGWVDEGVDGKVGNEVAGSPVAAPGRGASVLAWDRQGSHERGGRNLGRCVAGGRFPLVPGAWRDAFAHPCAGVR